MTDWRTTRASARMEARENGIPDKTKYVANASLCFDVQLQRTSLVIIMCWFFTSNPPPTHVQKGLSICRIMTSWS